MAVADALYPLVRDRLFYPADEEDGLDSHQVNEVLLAGTANPDFEVDVSQYWEKKLDAIVCHASQIGGRTREDFLKQRQEQAGGNTQQPMVENFRRWTIRRAQAQPPEEKK